MAVLEGNELVNVESVTALMSLFGARYKGSYIRTIATGFVGSGNPSYVRKTIISSDGSIITVPNIQKSGSKFTCNWSLNAVVGGLFYMRSSLTVAASGTNSRQNLVITPKTSLNTTTFTPASLTIGNLFGHVTTDETLFETVFRIKDGETFTYKEVYEIYTTIQDATTSFELYRIC